MLDIVLLYFLTKNIGKIAITKGLPPTKWKWITVLLWLVFEMIGLMIGVILFGTANLYSLMAFGLVCAFGGYLTVKYILDNKPDVNI